MTPHDLAELGMYSNAASLTLALGAAYKVFIDKFVPPGIDHAENCCSSIRGELAAKLAECCRPFVEPKGKQSFATVKLLGADGEPMDTSTLTLPSAIDSEAFNDAFQEFLHDEKRDFHRYWVVFVRKRRLQFVWAFVRLSVAAWAIASLLGLGMFAAWTKDLVSCAACPWLIATGLVTALPMVSFVLSLAPYALYSNGVATVED